MKIYSQKKIGSEKLYLILPPNHKFADKKGIFLEELNDEKILLYSKRETFTAIAYSLAFPFFTTDIFLRNGIIVQKNCVYKPILDSEVNTTYKGYFKF